MSSYNPSAKKQYNTIEYGIIKSKHICNNIKLNQLKAKILTKLEKEYPNELLQPSSKSGRYHPYVENQDYGLLLHSLGTVMVLVDLLQLGNFQIYKDKNHLSDLLKFAAFFHDIGKIVKPNDYPEHPRNGVVWIKENYHSALLEAGYSPVDLDVYLYEPIENHMRFLDNELLPMPSLAVEMADYIASRPYTNTFKSISTNLQK